MPTLEFQTFIAWLLQKYLFEQLKTKLKKHLFQETVEVELIKTLVLFYLNTRQLKWQWENKK